MVIFSKELLKKLRALNIIDLVSRRIDLWRKRSQHYYDVDWRNHQLVNLSDWIKDNCVGEEMVEDPNNKKRTVGHAWNSYTADFDLQEYYLDSTYWYSSKPIKWRKNSKQSTKYKTVWFGINGTHSYAWGKNRNPFK